MTDVISNVKIQQKPTSRRVCLQQSRTTLNSSSVNTEIPSNYLLINNGITSKKNSCVTLPLLPSSLLKTTQITSLKSSLKQLNNTPTTTKSVRFNFPLTQILHFYTPPSFDDDEEEEEEQEEEQEEHGEENELEDAFLELFANRYSPSDYDSNLYHPAIQQHLLDDASSNKLTLVLSNWPTVHPTRRFITQMVSLENVSWNNARSTIEGRVLVHNLAFEKKVTIRMSFNHWQTWVDIDAKYKETSKDDALDRFTFEFITPNHLSYLNRICNTSSCHLAVRYQVNGREFWDNNNEKNFNLEWVSANCGKDMNHHEENMSIKYLQPPARDQAISLYQQGKVNTALAGYYCQEDSNRQMKKEEYYLSLTSNQTNVPNDYYLPQPTHEQQSSLLVNSTQQQISAHFQLYLERKKRSEKRMKQLSNSNLETSSTSSSSSLLLPATRTEQLILLT
jgi:hypothetical protein